MSYYSKRIRVIHLLIICSLGLFASSCSTAIKPTSYFRNVTVDSLSIAMQPPSGPVLIVAGDQLSVVISSLNKEEDLIFNSGAAPLLMVGEKADFPGYNVETDGSLLMHKLGKIKAAGLTRDQLAEKIRTGLAPYLKDPMVSVQFINHKVTLMGEVKAPKLIYLPEDRISLTDVLASGGDLTADGRCDNIVIIRESGGTKLLHRVDLADASIFGSPWYWIANNDIVYVSVNDARIDQEAKQTRFSQFFSMTISALSLLIVILNLVLN